MTKTYKSDALAALHESMEDLHGAGVINKHTMREFDEGCLAPISEFTPNKIKALREREGVSQGVLARYLNVSVKAVASWEGKNPKRPNGAASKLLDLVERKGLDALA